MKTRFTTAVAAGLLLALAFGATQAQISLQELAKAKGHVARRTLAVPDLSNPRTLAAFENHARDVCGAGFPVTIERVPDDSPAGTFVNQNPRYVQNLSTTTCIDGVTVAYSSGPPPAPTPSFTVGDLGQPEAVDLLRRLSAKVCGAPATIQQLSRPSEKPAGSFDGQSPSADSVYACGMSLVVWTSTGPAPPPPPNPFPVGLLSDPAAVQSLAGEVRNACGGELPLNNLTRPSSRPAGAYDGQDPAPSAIYLCGETVTVWRSTGPLPPYKPPPSPWPWIAAVSVAILGAGIGAAAVIRHWLRPDPPRYAIRPGEPAWTVTPRGPARSLGPNYALRLGAEPPRVTLRKRLTVLSEEKIDDRDRDGAA